MKLFPSRLPPTNESCLYIYRGRLRNLVPQFSKCAVVADEHPHASEGVWYQFVWFGFAVNLYIATS